MLLEDVVQELENKIRVLEQQELDLQQCVKMEMKKLKECKRQLKWSRLT